MCVSKIMYNESDSNPHIRMTFPMQEQIAPNCNRNEIDERIQWITGLIACIRKFTI